MIQTPDKGSLYRPSGGALALILCQDPEVLIEGPAGTGKTRACLEYINYLCEEHSNLRVCIARKTRKSMSESVLQTFEDHVLGPGHPAKVGSAGRHNRQFYTYPNGSHIVLGGLDNPDRIMSTEYDVIYVAEATETTVEDWEKLNTRLRNKRLPWQQGIADCNPGSQYHWLNQRANQGRMTRILSRHDDNPHVDEAYLMKLRNLTGARRERLYLGHWVSEEGLVYPNWDPAKHIVRDLPEMRWHFASVDWGYRNPGCLQIWGVTEDNELYRVVEVYRTQKALDWWAEVCCALDREFNLAAVVADPSRNDCISFFNERISQSRNRHMDQVCRGADNRVRGKAQEDIVGIDLVRWGLGEGGDAPRVFFYADALRYGRDPVCEEAMQPCGTEEEFPGLVWREIEEKRLPREMPDPSCPDHGLDAARYACMFAWNKNFIPDEKVEGFAPDSFGAILKHNQVEFGDPNIGSIYR
jgi:phage terminase large subunit